MTKYAFVDLDNTLIHADLETYVGERPGDKVLKYSDREVYRAVLRPGALEFLAALRAVPDTKVYILTTSVQSYASHWNREFGLGFDPMHIFAREDQKAASSLDPQAFPNASVVALFDDLTEFDHRHGKIPFISRLLPAGQKVSYVRVEPYWGIGEWTAEDIQELISKGLRLSS